VRRHKDPFKLVAFAHGTTGVFRGCAPSTASYLYDYNIWTPLLSVGYAVVATNYVGLRNGMSKHKYIASAANTIVVYWSIAAALKAFPNDLTRECASIGHSQSGGTMYKVSEHELVREDSGGYLGDVSVAPSPSSTVLLSKALGRWPGSLRRSFRHTKLSE
jgi:hypothetical protein